MQPRLSFRVLARFDAWLNRIYGGRYNPLYHSGALTLVMLGVLIITGLYLLLFYRIGAPYDSIVRIDQQAWTGRWIRALHRFSSDAAVVAAAVHAFRMYAQRRTWGPRALAWVSGVILLGIVLVSGWTGYVMVWDTFGQVLAAEGARLLDTLPVFSEPIGRSFITDRDLPSAFFFLNLFAHIALPISIAFVLWLHVARVARPVLLPVRRVLWGTVVALLLLSLVWPPPLAPRADLLRVPADVPADWFYAFWLPLTQRMPGWGVWLASTLLVAVFVAVPWLTKPRLEQLPAPAEVNPRTCTGCEQCVHDCPYDAIAMVPRTDGREGMVALVKTELCTSCGICVGSCPPMAIGPLNATAREQLAAVRAFIAEQQPGKADVVMVGCTWSAARAEAERHGAKCFSVPCIGAMHSSTVEFLLRGGAGGVLVVGCPEHDGRTREGVTWAQERLFEGRKAELKERVDRNRIRLVQAALGESAVLSDAARAFVAHIESLAQPADDDEEIDVVEMCRLRHDVVESVP
jgi:ferredoxin/coenzyme F420-reducing hydrogenase delta subunit